LTNSGPRAERNSLSDAAAFQDSANQRESAITMRSISINARTLARRACFANEILVIFSRHENAG
jgi:hypothetical protein